MDEDIQLRSRDQLLRDTFTPAERLLFWTTCITVAVASWASDPRSFGVLGFFLIVGGFCLVILKTHEQTHPFFIDALWTRFWLLSAPVWLIALQFTAGALRDPLRQVEIKGELFLTIKDIHHWLPVSVASDTAWISVLGFGAVYLVAMNLFIVPKSRSFFERLLPYLCLNAVLIGIIGYLQRALQLDNPLFTLGTGRTDFFAFFPYDGHWAAFAMLWGAVCIAMALLTSRYDDGKDFIQSVGPWYLTGGVLLGATGFIVQARWPAVILLLSFSLMLLVFAIHFLAASKDPNRMSIALCSGLAGGITFAGGIFRVFQADNYLASANSLRRAAFEMFHDSPLLGWGMDSFAQLLPFYADDTLLGTRHDRAVSDILQMLAEIGILGSLPLCILIAFLVIRYLKGQHDIHLTNHLLIGCISCIALACFDSPFMSPAVCLSFWLIFFSAFRWGDLSRNRIDEVDAKPELVTHESKRRVPFHTQQYDEKLK